MAAHLLRLLWSGRILTEDLDCLLLTARPIIILGLSKTVVTVSLFCIMKRILDLISQGEGEQLDFKREISSSIRIAKSLSAFANHKGGTLLIGVNDNKTK